MSLETATYINQLVATNPVHTDPTDVGDGHLRLIKQVLQNTFPNVSGGATATQADLSAVAGFGSQVTSGGFLLAADPPTSGSTQGTILVSGTLVVAVDATVGGGLTVDNELSVLGEAVIAGGAIISGGINTAGAGINVGSGGFAGRVGVTGPITATSTISAGGAFEGGSGQLVPSGAAFLFPSASGIPGGYALANSFISITPPAGWNWVLKS